LILGGLGFVGKHLVRYLVKKEVASKIRVADKIMVQMARLGKEFSDSFDKVECIQANLTHADAVARVFTDAGGDFNVVINLASETKYSQSEQVYEEGIVKLSTVVAQEAMKHKTERFIELSTAEVYEHSSKPVTESGAVKPYHGIGKAKAKAEEQLRAVKGLPLVVVRPGIVYGPGDIRGLAPRLCIAAVYKKTGEAMEFPQWFEEQKINTVHVHDVVRSLVHLISNGEVGKAYNLADKNDTDQKKLNVILEKLFGIKIGHMGVLKSEASKLLPIDQLVSEVNAEHAPTWSKMISEAKLEYSPLSPWLDEEALLNSSMCVDGSAIEKTGFTYEKPNVTEELLRDEIKYAVAEGWFPANLI